MLEIVKFSHKLIKEVIRPGDSVIDATVGNGNDTVFLASLVDKTGKVYGFDVQEQAIENTTEKITLTGLQAQVELFQMGHEKLDQVISKDVRIQGAIFNLGYLPKSDKKIITQPDTTVSAIQKILPQLAVKGRIILVVYHGHEGGGDEKEAVLSFSKSLDQKKYQVLQYQFINQINNPPFVIAIEKLK